MQELTNRPAFRQLLLGSFVLALVICAWLVLHPFLVPIAWAGILAYASWPLYLKLLRLFKARATLAAVVMTFCMAIVVIMPVLWLFFALKSDLGLAFNVVNTKLAQGNVALPPIVTNLPMIGADIAAWFAHLLSNPAVLKTTIQSVLSNADKAALDVLGGIGKNIAKMGLALLTLFFTYRDGLGFIQQVQIILESLLGTRSRAYVQAVGGATRGVVYGILLTALVQGAVAGVGYWVAGLEAPITLAAITVIFALIPFGTPLVWGSLGLWLVLTDHTFAGLGLLLWGGLVVSWVDNIVRPLIVAQNVKIPFLLAFFGVLGGLAAFGLIGLFIGPVILAVAYAVWHEWLDAHS